MNEERWRKVTFRVTPDIFERWENLENKYPRGMRAMILRQLFYHLLVNLEQGVNIRPEALVDGVVRKAGTEEVTDSDRGGAFYPP